MLLAKNRRALFDFDVIEKFMAGIVLRGFEVKAIKEGKVNFEGAFIKIIGGEAFVVNMQIGRYSKQSQKEVDQTRSRKLLLNKRELERLAVQLNQKGKTALPLALLLSHDLVKLEFAVAKGRKKYEKRAVQRERQIKRDVELALKDR